LLILAQLLILLNGAVVISSILIAEDMAEEFKERLANEDRTTLEREYLGSDTLAVTAEMFSYWKFDDELVNK
jgi:hypothetical protein